MQLRLVVAGLVVCASACREPPACRSSWEAGQHRAYRVVVNHAVNVDAPGGVLAAPLAGALAFTALVHVRANHPTELEAWISGVEEARWTALGTTIPNAAARVGAWRARILLGVDGEATEVNVAAGMERADGEMFRAILVPAFAGGDRVSSPLGAVGNVQEVQRVVDGPACERVSRAAGPGMEPSFMPPNLRGSGTRSGHWMATRRFARGALVAHNVDAAIDVTDGARVVGRGTHVQQWMLVDADAAVPAPVEMVRVEALPSPARSNALLQRAEGMTAQTLVGDIRAHHEAGQLPDHSRWLWRASGVLELDPLAPGILADACVEGALATPGMALALDVLAAAGTPAAQAAMVKVLDHATTRKRDDHGALVQRAILVERPVPDLVAWMAREAHGSASPATRRYAASTLGALLWRAAPEVARVHVPVLQRSLEKAESDDDARAALMGMGNSRRGEYVEAVVGRAGDRSAMVRAGAVAALGTLPGNVVVDALLKVIEGEQEPLVRTAAFTAVAAREWSGDAADRLVVAVGRGPAPQDADVEALLATRMDTPARQRALWNVTRERGRAGKDAMHRLVEALGRIPATAAE